MLRRAGRFASVGAVASAAGPVLGAALLASGCTAIRNHRGYLVDQALVDAVQPGIDNRQSVERTLGRPAALHTASQRALDAVQGWRKELSEYVL